MSRRGWDSMILFAHILRPAGTRASRRCWRSDMSMAAHDLRRGDTGGDNAHQRWLALVSVGPWKTRINRRPPASGTCLARRRSWVRIPSAPLPITHCSTICYSGGVSLFYSPRLVRGDKSGATIERFVTMVVTLRTQSAVLVIELQLGTPEVRFQALLEKYE